MYNPRVQEALKMFEVMTNKHVEELFKSELVWDMFTDPDGYVVQVAPKLVLTFKR